MKSKCIPENLFSFPLSLPKFYWKEGQRNEVIFYPWLDGRAGQEVMEPEPVEAIQGRILVFCGFVYVCVWIRESGSSCSRLIPPFILHTDSTNSWHCS